ncbi:2-oxoglutarate dehydrogenase E1 component [bacterium]|nr:2-oxoglutarate dehydrogenase E1 component [bacterium]
MNRLRSAVSQTHSVTGWNAEYIEGLYEEWKTDPDSLPESWRMFFQGFELAMCPRDCVATSRAEEQSRVASLIFGYRSQGHFMAKIDPFDELPPPHPDLELEQFGLSEDDLDKVFDTGHLYGPQRAKLQDIVDILQTTYCGSIGAQYTHIQDVKIRRWLQEKMEPIQNQPNFSRNKKLDILSHLIDADQFETFLHTRYPGQKRFSLEGAETLIPAIHSLVELAPEVGVEQIVIGMAHRGRLNILTNILDKSYAVIFSEFEGNFLPGSFSGDSDVKYHKGFSSDHRNRYGRSVHISLAANPSHLELVNPVVEGRARAKQRQLNDIEKRSSVLPLLIHGDAAFAGQGIVAETMNLSQLDGYRTGGTVHIIINNQIGFTTLPRDSRSTHYATDIAKFVEAPIFHVNGDDPEATVFVVELALEFRQKFGQDVVVDMICYRRHGHNEGDEPAFTQPALYKKIRNHPPIRQRYTQKLLESGVLSEEEVARITDDFQTQLQRSFEYAKETPQNEEVQAFESFWKGLQEPYKDATYDTSVSHEDLITVAKGLTNVPSGFKLNPKVKRKLPKFLDAVKTKGEVDWAQGESLAFGSLLHQGIPVRLSGQDSARGTFSQRHAVWQNIEGEGSHTPLNHISEDQAHFCVYNSPLAEVSVLGFEYGYALAEPRMLVIWEAQFGDFANGAQPVIDQFIGSSQSKWNRTNGLVMFLPHGYEGQGPEHSYAYLDRYLAVCAEDNVQVANVTTPAQLFHLLRRQMLRPYRRPLILMTPKSMLRNKYAVSSIDEFTNGHFREVLDDPSPAEKAERLVLCSGKLFWELYDRREQEGKSDIDIIRIEQLYPLSRRLMDPIVERYKHVEEIIWAQEETKNRGAWSFIRPWLQFLFPNQRIRYIGRGYAASPATGSLSRHRKEQERIIEATILGETVPHDITILPEGARRDQKKVKKKSSKSKTTGAKVS